MRFATAIIAVLIAFMGNQVLAAPIPGHPGSDSTALVGHPMIPHAKLQQVQHAHVDTHHEHEHEHKHEDEQEHFLPNSHLRKHDSHDADHVHLEAHEFQSLEARARTRGHANYNASVRTQTRGGINRITDPIRRVIADGLHKVAIGIKDGVRRNEPRIRKVALKTAKFAASKFPKPKAQGTGRH